MRVKFFAIVISFLFLMNCASQKSVTKVEEGDALKLLTDLTRESRSKKNHFSENEIAELTTKLDSLCNHELSVTRITDFDTLHKEVDATSHLDSLFLRYAVERGNDRLATSLREFKFRTLVKTQARMQDMFENNEAYQKLEANREANRNEGNSAYKDFETHGNWVFKEKVSWMLPYVQANEQFSVTKTILLNDLIGSLSKINTPAERKRCWLAIDRMSDDIDLQKSESDYQPFQRSAQGIFARQGETIDRLKSQAEKETDKEILEFSKKVIQKVEDRQNAAQDEEFSKKVELSKEINRRFNADSATKVDEPTASEWFARGSEAKDEKLKIKYFSNAIQLNPQYTGAYNNRGTAYQALGQDELALQDYSKAIELNPNFEPAYFNRGNIRERMGRYEDAVGDFSKAIQFQPRYTLAYFHRGRCYKGLNKFNEALEDFNKAIELDPGSATAYNNRADMYRKLKNDEQAIRDYTRSIELDAKNPMAYNNRGLTYYNLGKNQEAIRDYENAIRISPDYAASYYNLGTVHWSLKNWQEVIKAWEKYLKLEPNDKHVREWLAFVKKEFKSK